MGKLGSTYRCNLPPRHIWVIISNPSDHEGRFLFVNFTTRTERCLDDACILEPGDYPPFLTQITTVAYSRFVFGDLAGLKTLLETGQFSEMPLIPPITLQKIISGARSTPEMPKAAKSLLPHA
jgi:hypothetical protein